MSEIEQDKESIATESITSAIRAVLNNNATTHIVRLERARSVST